MSDLSRTASDSLQALPTDANDDPRLLAAVKEYVSEVEAGRKPNRQDMLARHPDIAKELSVCLQGLAFLNSAAAQMHTDDGPPNEAQQSFESELASAKPLGDFKLIREIGRGGMGIVYEALQLSLGRHVAVKVLPLAAALDPRQLQRFRNEAQAAAQLHHTNIVPVHAVGCERSVHFYAMQLIEGQSLADVIKMLRRATGRDASDDPATVTLGTRAPRAAANGVGKGAANGGAKRIAELHAASEPPSSQPFAHRMSDATENLSSLRTGKPAAFFRSVAQLGVQAADALSYAHQIGIVHRDIKPANLLLDERGTLWITDFGLAHVYADASGGLTQTGDMLGTLRYMSPEQASGRAVVLDQRTDVYSLGVTLYELLTLERAISGDSRNELLHQLNSEDPRSIRSIDPMIPVELETIIGKASAKEPADRYESAGALASDLQRFLRDEPILARPPSLMDKAIKWTRRHKPFAISAVALLLMIAIGSIVMTVIIANEQAKTAAAYRAEKRLAIAAETARERATDSAKEARQVVGFLTRVATDELPKEPQFTAARKKILESALNYYQHFLSDSGGDVEAANELNAARASVTAILSELDAVDESMHAKFQIRLLSQPIVQDDLKLSPDQRAQAKALAARFPIWQRRDLKTQPTAPRTTAETTGRREELTREVDEMMSALGAVLSADQVMRLRELQRQISGVRAFNDVDVQRALALSSEQRDIISSVQANMGGPRGPSKNPAQEAEFRERQESAEKAITDRLTPEQIRTWKNLLGRPFEGRWTTDFFRPPESHGDDAPPQQPPS